MARRKMPLTGGCQCGAVRYAISSDPAALYICHCRECRKQSASAFGISAFVEKSAFRLIRGKVASWTRATDSGRRLRCNFCPECGSRLWHERADAAEPVVMISVKGGSLDEPLDVGGAVHTWASRKLPGVLIPESATQFLEEPD